MRIDAHVHGMHADVGPDGTLVAPVRPIWNSADRSPAAYVEASREAGIEQVLVLDPPHVSFALKELFGDYVLASPQVDLDAATPDDIDALFQQGACGIKFIAPGAPYGSDAYLPLYDVIRAHHGVAVFHTGYLGLGLFEPGGVLGRRQVVDINDMRPAALDRVARALPGLKILMAHFGNPWWEEAWKMIASHRTLYADLSGGTAYRRSMSMWSQIFCPDGRLDTAAVGKLCFASDATYFCAGTPGSSKHMEFYDRLYAALDIPDELQKQVDRENIRRLVERKPL